MIKNATNEKILALYIFEIRLKEEYLAIVLQIPNLKYIKILITEKIKIVTKYLLSIPFVPMLVIDKLETYKVDPIMIMVSIRNKTNFLYELFKRLLFCNDFLIEWLI